MLNFETPLDMKKVSSKRNIGRLAIFLVSVSFVLGLYGCSQDLTDVRHLEKARSYYQSGKVYSAVIELKNALQINPNNSDARHLLGKAYLDLAEGPAAEKELRRALRFGQTGISVLTDLGLALNQQKRYQATIEELGKVKVGQNIESSELRAVLAEAYLGQRNLKKAKLLMTQAEMESASVPRLELAKAKLAMAEQKYTPAMHILNDLIASSSKSDEARFLKAKLLEIENKNQEAIDVYNKLISETPRNRLTSRISASYVALYYLYLREGKIDKAKESADFLYSANAKHPLTNYMQGLLAFKQNDFVNAVEYLQTSYSRNDKNPQVLLLLGAANYALGHYNQTITHLESFLVIAPRHTYAAKILGATYIKLGDTKNALNTLKTSLAYTPDDAELLSFIGDAAIRTGNYNEGKMFIRKSIESGGSQSSGRLKLATALMGEGDYEQAVKELELALLNDKSDYRATYFLVLTHIKKKDFDSAIAKATEFLKTQPNDPKAYNLLANVYVVIKDYSNAQKYFKKAVLKDINYLPSYLSLSRLALTQENIGLARNYLDIILDKDKKNLPAFMLLAQIEERQGNKDKAIRWIQKAIATNPKALQPRIILANYYIKTKQTQKALSLTKENLVIQRDNPILNRMRASSLLLANKLDKAIIQINKLVKLQPDEPEHRVHLGKIYIAQGNILEGQRWLEQALDVRNGYYPAIKELVQIQSKAGNYKAAHALAIKVQRSQPKSPAGFVLTGDIYMHEKKYHKAEKVYSMVASKFSHSQVIKKWVSALQNSGADWDKIKQPIENWFDKEPNDFNMWMYFAGVALSKDKTDTAINAYRKVLVQYPDNFAALNNLASILYEKDKSSEAVNMAKRAYSLKPDLPQAQDTYGWILVQENKLVEALPLLKNAYQKLSQTPDVAYHYAMALAKTGNKDNARKILSQVRKKKGLDLKLKNDIRLLMQSL